MAASLNKLLCGFFTRTAGCWLQLKTAREHQDFHGAFHGERQALAGSSPPAPGLAAVLRLQKPGPLCNSFVLLQTHPAGWKSKKVNTRQPQQASDGWAQHLGNNCSWSLVGADLQMPEAADKPSVQTAVDPKAAYPYNQPAASCSVLPDHCCCAAHLTAPGP